MALLFFEAILFGLFTLAMFTEQAPPRPHGAPALHEARPLPRPALGPVSARTAPTLAASAQISSILADQTGIERLKNDHVPQQVAAAPAASAATRSGVHHPACP
jgi:hypothetical protein